MERSSSSKDETLDCLSSTQTGSAPSVQMSLSILQHIEIPRNIAEIYTALKQLTPAEVLQLRGVEMLHDEIDLEIILEFLAAQGINLSDDPGTTLPDLMDYLSHHWPQPDLDRSNHLQAEDPPPRKKQQDPRDISRSFAAAYKSDDNLWKKETWIPLLLSVYVKLNSLDKDKLQRDVARPNTYLLLTSFQRSQWEAFLPDEDRHLLRMPAENVHYSDSSLRYYGVLHWLDNLSGGVNQLVSALLSLTLVVGENFGLTELLTLLLVLVAILSSHPAIQFPSTLEASETKSTQTLRSLPGSTQQPFWAQRSLHSFQVPRYRLLPKYLTELCQLSLGIAVFSLIDPAEDNRLYRALIIISILESILSLVSVFLFAPVVLLPLESGHYAMSLLPGKPTGVIVHISDYDITLVSWRIFTPNGVAVPTQTLRPTEEAAGLPGYQFAGLMLAAFFVPLVVFVILLAFGRNRSGDARHAGRARLSNNQLFAIIQVSTISFVLAVTIALVVVSSRSRDMLSSLSDLSDSLFRIDSAGKLRDIIAISSAGLLLGAVAGAGYLLGFLKSWSNFRQSMGILTGIASGLAVAALIYYAAWKTRFDLDSDDSLGHLI